MTITIGSLTQACIGYLSPRASALERTGGCEEHLDACRALRRGVCLAVAITAEITHCSGNGNRMCIIDIVGELDCPDAAGNAC